MIPPGVLSELQGLIQIEEMLIAGVLPIMKVYVKPGGQWYCTRHCINLLRNPETAPTMKGKENTFKDVIIRRAKVETALKWLTLKKFNSKILRLRQTASFHIVIIINLK